MAAIDQFEKGMESRDFFQFKTVSPDMINFTLNTGQTILNQQRDKWMPGVSGLWNSLKVYFAVSNVYVYKKLFVLNYPISNKNWIRLPADEILSSSSIKEKTLSHKWALPAEDLNAPDLYIPLMSFMSYVLLMGLLKGAVGSDFSPDYLVNAVWRCLILQSLETVTIRVGLGFMQSNLPVLDIFAYTGYKYVGLSINSVGRQFGPFVGGLSSLYYASMLAYFVLKSMAAAIPSNTGGPPRHLMLLGFATLQFCVMLILCWL